MSFEIQRTFRAPRERVWKAWTDEAQLKQWWGPAGFKVHTCKVDLRPGGTFLYGMTAPDGTEMWGKFVYREIKAPEKLVFVVSFSDPQAGVTRSVGCPVHFSQTPARVERPAPLLGEHTREVLREHGYGDAEIDRFVTDGVVAAP